VSNLKAAFENLGEALSVPAFHEAYRELGNRHKLWGKGLDELVDFFSGLSGKKIRRIFRAFGLQIIVSKDDRLEIYVGAGKLPGLLAVDVPIKPEALKVKGRAYECPCCGKALDADYMENSAISAIVCLYVDEYRVREEVVKFCMAQPIEVCFPYAGRKRWHEADVLRIEVEGVLADKLGLPPIVSPELLKQVIAVLNEKLGFDIERWAEIRARNIREGIEPEPYFFGYKRVDEGA